jgi:hypothetical protein
MIEIKTLRLIEADLDPIVQREGILVMAKNYLVARIPAHPWRPPCMPTSEGCRRCLSRLVHRGDSA